MSEPTWWPRILRVMWLIAALAIGLYAGGSIVVSPFFPNGWLNSAIVVVPACAAFAFLLIRRNPNAWIAGMIMLAACAVAVVLLEVAYSRFGTRTIGLCAGLLCAAYSIWSLKTYDQIEFGSTKN